MAKLLDPDDLLDAGPVPGAELTINTTAKTFTLNVAGALIAKDGVTLQALYSAFIKLWQTATYQPFPFPMYAIDALSGQFQFGTDGASYSGWAPANDATRNMLRDGGWSEWSAAGVKNRVYAGIVSLGSVSANAQLYYHRTSTRAVNLFPFLDEVNSGIQVYGSTAGGDATAGNFDEQAYFKSYVREYAKTYDDSVLGDTGKSTTGAFTVNMLLSDADDLDVIANDAAAGGATNPWQRILVRYFSANFSKDIDLVGTPRNFGVVIDVGTHSGIDGVTSAGGNTLTSAAAGILVTGSPYSGGSLKIHSGANKGTYLISGNPTANVVTITTTFPSALSTQDFTIYPAVPLTDGGTGYVTLKQIYTKVQYLLRQNSDIDATAASVIGKTADLLLKFVGSRLDAGSYLPENPNGGGSGVIIEGLAPADVNSVRFYDNAGTYREYPYQSTGVLAFNAVLVGAGSYYRLYFTTTPGGDDYGEAGAITVNDAAGAAITGTIGSASIPFTFDFTNNSQGGRVASTDTAVTLVAGRPGSAKPVVAAGLLTASKAISISAVAEQDRAYTA